MDETTQIVAEGYVFYLDVSAGVQIILFWTTNVLESAHKLKVQ